MEIEHISSKIFSGSLKVWIQALVYDELLDTFLSQQPRMLCQALSYLRILRTFETGKLR